MNSAPQGWSVGAGALLSCCLLLAGCASVETAAVKGARPAAGGEVFAKRSASPSLKAGGKKAKLSREAGPGAGASWSAGASPASTPASGLYHWARSVDFDVLDGAWLDPATGTLNLFGHRSSTGTRSGTATAVPYLELLAEALETDAPVFSLEWTPQSEKLVDRALTRNFEEATVDEITSRMAGIFDANGRLNANGVWFFTSVGASVRAGMNRYEVNAAALRATGRARAANTLEGLGTWVECQRAGDPNGAFEGIKVIWAELGIYERCHEVAGQFNRGELTENQTFDLIWPLTLERLTEAFGFPNGKYTGLYRQHRSRGMDANPSMDEAMYVFQQDLNSLPRLALNELEAKLEEVSVPPEITYQVIGARPMVRPVFQRMVPHSQLARIAYEADVYAKQLFDQPALKGVVPGYESYFSFLKRRGERSVASQGHLWLAPGRVRADESSDGLALRIENVDMRFFIERYAPGRISVAEPQLTAFANQLTAAYDGIAARASALWELREAVKVLVVADWLKRGGHRVALPSAGRARWSAPAETPGVVFMTMAVRQARTGAIVMAAGGVDFRGDQPPTILRGRLLRVGGRELTPAEFQELLERVYGGRLPAPRPLASLSTMQVDAASRRVLSVATRAGETPIAGGALAPARNGEEASLWSRDEVAAAERALREAIAATTDPKKLAALELMWSRALHAQGRDDEAMAHLRKGAALDPESEMLQLMAAEEFNRRGELADCVAALEKALALNPHNPATPRLLADVRARLAAPAGGPPGTLVPFRWAASEVRGGGESLETIKARELPDLHVAPLRLSPMARADYRALLEKEAYLAQRRAELVAPMADTAASNRVTPDAIKTEVAQLDAQIEETRQEMIRIEVDWEQEGAGP